MCGLVGVAGDTTNTWKDIFTDLLIVDSLRGAHSTGVAAVARWQSQVDLVKRPGGPHNLIGMEEYKKALQYGVKVLIGHNRYATIGEHTVENAHPFAFPSLVGAHNGTLDKSSIKLLYEHEKLGTDSEAIYSNIHHNGLKDTASKLRGAWALTWYDNKTNSINFLRNDRRPLWYCYSEDRCTLLWASEVAMLQFVLERAKKKSFKDEFYMVDADQHHSWEVPDSISKKFDVPDKVEMKGAPPEPVTYYYGGPWHYTSNNGGTRDNVTPFPKKTGNANSNTCFAEKRVDTSKFRPPYKDARGKVINKKEFNKLTADGCVFCGDNNIDWGEFIKPLRSVEGYNVFLCEPCYNDEEIFEICQHMV